ncbi:LysR family transcriptional regulator [Comamonas aquatica]|uniref:LysR family transcriptional regulator n=1 Tax=Comamonas aquatica TaxID=225991 RepID=UPI003D0290FA
MRTEPGLVPEMLVFAKVVELRSFAAAARQLELTTSAVSRSVGRLEAHWGVQLLHRTTRSLSLTELGAEVYAACSQLAHAASDIHAIAGHYRGVPRGTVRLTAPTVFGEIWLSAQLPALRRQWPELEVAVSLSDQIQDLAQQGLDLAIRLTRPEQLPQHMVARALRQVRYIAVASPAYLQGLAMRPQHPQDLDHAHGVACITLGYGDFQHRLQWVHQADPGQPPAVAEVTVHAPLSIDSSTGIIHLALQHQGIGLVADFAAQAALDSGALVPVLPDWRLTGNYAPRTAYALYMPSRHVPLKVRALIDHLVEAGRHR